MRKGLETTEVRELRRLYEQAQARVRELEASQRQLEVYAEDLRRTFAELRRQLGHMNELHRISTIIGSVLEPKEVMARTLEGLGRLVEHDLACIYLVEDGSGVRHARQGSLQWAPPRTVVLGHGPLGQVLAGTKITASSEDQRRLTVAMRAHGSVVGALHLARPHGAQFTDYERKLVDLVAAEAAAANQNARLHEETQRLATVDQLTGVFNYRYFNETLSLEVDRARRLGYAVGLLMLDLDKFKLVNDTFGHPIGDAALRAVAEVLRTSLRQTDVVSRCGGEEFAVILPGLGARGVRAVGEKLRRAVRALEPVGQDRKVPFPLTISVGGVSQAPAELATESLIHDADAALYEAKRRGKDCVYVVNLSDDVDESPGQPGKR